MSKRSLYLILIAFTIISGLSARAIASILPDVVNLYLGDALYAFMIYCSIAFFVPQKPVLYKAGIAVTLCYAIEISQLYQSAWINSIRATLPGRLILGSGFLWSDLLAYAVGVTAACLVDKLWIWGRIVTVKNSL